MIKKLEKVKIKKGSEDSLGYVKSESLLEILNKVIEKQNEIIDFVNTREMPSRLRRKNKT